MASGEFDRRFEILEEDWIGTLRIGAQVLSCAESAVPVARTFSDECGDTIDLFDAGHVGSLMSYPSPSITEAFDYTINLCLNDTLFLMMIGQDIDI